MIPEHELRFRVKFHFNAAFAFLRRFVYRHCRWQRLRGDVTEILVDELNGILNVNIADDYHHGVIGRVVDAEEFRRFPAIEHRDVRGPPDNRHPVRVRGESCGDELFIKFAARVGIYAHSAFLFDCLAFHIKLAQNGVFQPVCLQHRPQLQLVRGQCHGVNRIVHGGAGVEAGAAVLRVNFGIFAGDNPRFGGFLLRFEFRCQFGDFFGIGAIALGAFHVKRVAYPVDLRQNRLFLFIVFSADSLRAFEQHVL